MRDLPDLRERQPCEQRMHIDPATPADGGYEFVDAQRNGNAVNFPQLPNTFVRTSVPGPEGVLKVTGEIPSNLSSSHMVMIFSGFLMHRGHAVNAREQLAAQGIAAVTSDRLTLDAAAKVMALMTKETGFKSFHFLGYSHGGADATEVADYIDGENVETLTLVASRSLTDHTRTQMLGRTAKFVRQSGSFLPGIRGSLLSNPFRFARHSIGYADYLLSNLPGHISHGLGEVAVLNVADKLRTLHDGRKVATGGVFFKNDAYVPEEEALDFERQGFFDAFHMLANPKADHGWLVSHAREVITAYRNNILSKLDPVYARRPIEPVDAGAYRSAA